MDDERKIKLSGPGCVYIRCLEYFEEEDRCMIRCVYTHFIAPLTIYLGRSFPRRVRCLSNTCSFFCRFYRVSFSEGF